MALSLVFQILLSGFEGRKKPRASVNVPAQGLQLAPDRAVRVQEDGFPA